MNREKAIKLYNELKDKCPGLILAGSVLKDREDNIRDIDLIFVGKIFPIHLLPVGDIDTGTVSVKNRNVLRFKYKGEQVDIHRTSDKNLPAVMSRLSGRSIKI